MIGEILGTVEAALGLMRSLPGMIATILFLIVGMIVAGAVMNAGFEIARSSVQDNPLAQNAITAAQSTASVVGTFDDSKAIYKVIVPIVIGIAGAFGFHIARKWHIVPITAIAMILAIYVP